MTHPDDVARLREIKRLLERIQRLPTIAGMPANGLLDEPVNGLDTARHDGPANGFRNGHAGGHAGRQSGRADAFADRHLGPPHPSAAADLAPEPEPAGPPPRDPLPPPFDPVHGDGGRSDYWAADPMDDPAYDPADAPVAGSRALVLTRASAGGGLGFSPWVFIAATAVNTIVAAVLAVVITLGLARREQAPAETAKVAVAVKPSADGQSPADQAVPRPVELLPVGSAKEPLRLEAMKPARLPFVVRPDEAAQDSFILVLTGLPANATLSGAGRMGADTWHLSPGALQRLEIVVPEWSAAVYEVGVELRRTNGVLAAQTKLWLAVPPPPAPTPTSVSLDEAALKEMVRTGDKLLSRGDVVAARAMYERAAAMGSAPAALAMGTTYDPRRLWALGVFGMVGNKDRARQWYERADELGHPEAKARIKALQ
jgi:hypothetical protein